MVDYLWRVDLQAFVLDVEAASGLKPKELAALLGFNIKTYYQWRNGTSSPDGHSTAKLFIYARILENEKGIKISPKLKY